MPTVKDKVLIGITRLPKQNQARDLQALGIGDVHNLVHVLYALNRQGLVGFRLDKRTNRQTPTNIFLTKHGRKAVSQLRIDQ